MDKQQHQSGTEERAVRIYTEKPVDKAPGATEEQSTRRMDDSTLQEANENLAEEKAQARKDVAEENDTSGTAS